MNGSNSCQDGCAFAVPHWGLTGCTKKSIDCGLSVRVSFRRGLSLLNLDFAAESCETSELSVRFKPGGLNFRSGGLLIAGILLTSFCREYERTSLCLFPRGEGTRCVTALLMCCFLLRTKSSRRAQRAHLDGTLEAVALLKRRSCTATISCNNNAFLIGGTDITARLPCTGAMLFRRRNSVTFPRVTQCVPFPRV
jgi:hypothetical protein